MEERRENEPLERLVERYYRVETAGLHAGPGLWASLEPRLAARGRQRYTLAAACAVALVLVVSLAATLWERHSAPQPLAPMSPVAVLPPGGTPAGPASTETPGSTTAVTPDPAPTGAVSAVPALQAGTLEEAERALGVRVPLPRELPAGAVREEDVVRYYVAGEQGMISIGYRVGQRALALEYLKRSPEQAAPAGERTEAVGPFEAHVRTQAKEPSDPLPPYSVVAWRDGDLTVRVAGDLTVEQLLAVARSMYD
jgi:hypothetical protein